MPFADAFARCVSANTVPDDTDLHAVPLRRLLLTLTNFWPDYGGMPAYVRCGRGSINNRNNTREQ